MRLPGFATGPSHRVRLFAWVLVVGWTGTILVSWRHNQSHERESARDTADIEAATVYNLDLAFRLWAAGHGGVYVPVAPDTPPSPYLEHIPERDLTTPSGRQLTLMNPAYVMRQVNEHQLLPLGISAHITSLNPLRPENGPDAWEREALEAFERGETEMKAEVLMNGVPFFRLMRPMRTEASCIKCHGSQGYRVGDVRGGISASVPMAAYEAASGKAMAAANLSHGLLWVLGLAGIGFGAAWLQSGNRQLGLAMAGLERNERRFRTVMDQAADAIYVYDEDGRIVDVNARACADLGYARDELLRLSIQDLDSQVALDESSRRRWSRMEPNQTITFERTHRRKDGSTFPVEVSASLFLLEERRLLLAVARDVTDRKRAEEALRASEENYRGLYAAISGGVLVQASDGRITHVNDVACELLGLDRDAILGRDSFHPGWRTIHEDGSPFPGEQHPTQVALRTGGSVRNTVMGIHNPRDNAYRWILISCEPVKDPRTGEVGSAVATITDITDRKRLEDQLREAQKMRAIGQLAGGIAHNFNNLLLAISGNAELLIDAVDRLPASAEQRTCLHSVDQLRRAVEMGMSLTGRLLSFCRRQPLHSVVLEPNKTIRGMLEMLRGVIGPGIELVLEAGENVGYLCTDPGRIEETILNLAINARDAMKGNGRLTIRTACIDVGSERAAILGVRPGPFVRIAVCDSGAGMDEATRRRLFEPFFTTKPLGQGAGLGLATIYGFVTQAGGCIEVQSEPGKGTMFELLIPAMVEPPAQIPELPRPKPQGEAGQTVLVCDDDVMVRQLIARYLTSKGYQVLEAIDAEEAMAICTGAAMPIDVLVTDVQMTTMTGPELARELRRHYPSIRCVLISGHPDTIETPGPGEPRLAFVGKPFHLPDLLDVIRNLDGEAGAQS